MRKLSRFKNENSAGDMLGYNLHTRKIYDNKDYKGNKRYQIKVFI